MQSVAGAVCLRIKRPGREPDYYCLPSSAQVKNGAVPSINNNNNQSFKNKYNENIKIINIKQ
jgi:hypothetical protein